MVNFKKNLTKIKLRTSDQHLCHVHTPTGEYNLTAATYGFKNISAIAQDIANEVCRKAINAVSFVDDVVQNHAPDATPDELYSDAKRLMESCQAVGVLLNPEKTWFFADMIAFSVFIPKCLRSIQI